MGDHGKGCYDWEKAGQITLKKGEITIDIIDTSAFYGRVEGVILSTDANLKLPQTEQELIAMSQNYPAWILHTISKALATFRCV